MASISSLMGSSSSTSSIYGNRTTNIISGLASGLDTESMIEGMVQGYQQKISQLQQQNTKLQWQQEAYQSISNKLVEFARKYTSYNSPTTNLFSNSFFNNAVLTSTGGTYADLVSASGKSTSEVVLNAVTQLAQAARKTYSAAGLDQAISIDSGTGKITATGGKVDLTSQQTVSTISGSLTLTFGGTQEITLDFGENELFAKADGTLDTQKLQDEINKKLADETVTVGDSSVAASERISVTVGADGTLSVKENGSNSIAITGATGDFKNLITADSNLGTGIKDIKLDTTIAVTSTAQSQAEYLEGKSFTVSLNGQSKTFTLDMEGVYTNEGVQEALQAALDDAFGADRVTVGLSQEGAFSFTVNSGDLFSISSTAAGESLFGEGVTGLSSYVNTSKSLEQLLGTNEDGTLKGLTANGDGTYELKINGTTIGSSYTKDTALETILNDINNNAEAGVSVNYSNVTNQFVFTAKQTGASGKVEFDGSLGALFSDDKLVASASQDGQDAKINVTVNGQAMELTRSSNTFEIDGMSITVNGEFTPAEGETGVTFSSKTDTDAVVDVIKQMVEDYNALLTEVKNAYTTQPLKQSDGRTGYEPLTDEDKADMTESEIERYEEQAKTGLLYMDSDLSSLYNMLRSAITPGGADGQTLRSIGINTSYSDGLTTITLDETALRQALETNPDQVRDIFTKSQENGSSTNGLMASIKKATDRYAATEGAVKGVLIEKAGSQYSPSKALDNTILNQMNQISEQISRWQDKMSDRVDYYTNKFTQLELLIQQMNSQSSSLAGLMGGY